MRSNASKAPGVSLGRAQANELDRKIAVWLGWTNVGCQQGGNILFGEPDDDYNADYPTNKHSIPVPEYAARDADAITLLPVLAERGYRLLLACDAAGCEATVFDRCGEEIASHRCATVSGAVSHAICKLIDSLTPRPVCFGL